MNKPVKNRREITCSRSDYERAPCKWAGPFSGSPKSTSQR
jgi:hypothetical protein